MPLRFFYNDVLRYKPFLKFVDITEEIYVIWFGKLIRSFRYGLEI